MNYQRIKNSLTEKIKTRKDAIEQVNKARQKLIDTGARYTIKGRLVYVPQGKEREVEQANAEYNAASEAETKITSEIYKTQQNYLNNLVVIPGDLDTAKSILGDKVKVFNLPGSDKGISLTRRIEETYGTDNYKIMSTNISMQDLQKESGNNDEEGIVEKLGNVFYLLDNKIIGILVNERVAKKDVYKEHTYFGIPLTMG